MTKIYRWPLGLVMISHILLLGCVTSETKDVMQPHDEKSAVVGFIQVESTGPFFRKFQSQAAVRFFDVLNAETGERTRVSIEPETKLFVTKLSPGNYELIRLQIGEGPFRSESLPDMTFRVSPGKTVYLGIWRLKVDSPRTVRMLHWEAIDETPGWDLIRNLHGDIGDEPVEISLPEPATHQVRLFAVAPVQPRSKYFYRR